jgi:hypothetical protein
VKYAFIASQVGAFAVNVLCRALEMSVSGYYAWRTRAPSAHEQTDAALRTRIQQAFAAGRGVYGSPCGIRPARSTYLKGALKGHRSQAHERCPDVSARC